MFNKKGQAAVEYLVTYGWAFLAIIATVGVMSYFGLLNPSKYIPDTCEFGAQLQCEDHYIEDTKGITIRFKNNFEEDITITDAFGPEIVYLNPPVNISVGEIKRVDLNTTRELFVNTKEEFEIIIQFRRNDGTPTPSTPEHNVSGTLFGEIQSGALGLLS